MIDTRRNALKQLALILLASILTIGLVGLTITGDWRYLVLSPLVFGLPVAYLQGVFDRELWRPDHGRYQFKRVR